MPSLISALTASGVSATRRSPGAVSAGMPAIIGWSFWSSLAFGSLRETCLRGSGDEVAHRLGQRVRDAHDRNAGLHVLVHLGHRARQILELVDLAVDGRAEHAAVELGSRVARLHGLEVDVVERDLAHREVR